MNIRFLYVVIALIALQFNLYGQEIGIKAQHHYIKLETYCPETDIENPSSKNGFELFATKQISNQLSISIGGGYYKTEHLLHYSEDSEFWGLDNTIPTKPYYINQYYLTIPLTVNVNPLTDIASLQKYNKYITLNLEVGFVSAFLIKEDENPVWSNEIRTFDPSVQYGFHFTLFRYVEVGMNQKTFLRNFAEVQGYAPDPTSTYKFKHDSFKFSPYISIKYPLNKTKKSEANDSKTTPSITE